MNRPPKPPQPWSRGFALPTALLMVLLITTISFGLILVINTESRVSGTDLDNTRAKDVFAEMVRSGKPAGDAMAALGIEKVDASQAESLCRELLQANPKIVEDLKAGKTKAVGSLIGQAKQRNPNVNPGQFKDMCLKLVQSM